MFERLPATMVRREDFKQFTVRGAGTKPIPHGTYRADDGEEWTGTLGELNVIFYSEAEALADMRGKVLRRMEAEEEARKGLVLDDAVDETNVQVPGGRVCRGRSGMETTSWPRRK